MRNICIIDPYSDFPIDNLRLGRYHQIANQLVQKGFHVKIYISNISHRDKKKSNLTGENNIYNGIQYVVIESLKYKSHISISRILYEKIFIWKVIKDLESNITPDLIILRDPAIFISKSILHYINLHKVKYIVDIIDLWPELFELALPKFLSKYSNFIFSYFYRLRYKLLIGASAFTAVSPDYLNIATVLKPSVPAEVIYWGCDMKVTNEIIGNQSCGILKEFSLNKKDNDFWVIYSGTLGNGYDIKTIFKSAEILKNNLNIKFLIAGAGPLEVWVKNYINSYKPNNIVYLGLLPTTKLNALFKYCNIGLTSYIEKSTVSMPIKAYDYFASGLPIVNSLGRNLGQIVESESLGYNYKSEDPISLQKAILGAYNDINLNLKILNVKNISLKYEQINQYKKIYDVVNQVINI
jgi:hypothetical protein